jgi:hypothetical protein
LTTKIKGTAMVPIVEWAKTTYGDAVWSQILEGLNAEDRREIQFVQGINQYPVALAGTLVSRIVDVVCDGDLGRADSELRKMGRYSANQQLSGIYSLFVRFASPEQALARIATVVSTLYIGASATLEHERGTTAGTVYIEGLEEFAYAAPRLCGWAERALEMAGATSPRVTERAWSSGKIATPELVFDVAWNEPAQ